MSDMAQVIVPKSDQLNADDLIAGPMTIKITGVSIKGGTEQPIAISFEGDKGKPYKACKSMCRVMVTAWGADSKKYTGRSMTLYRDASVKWGGMEVGGIRISHMSDIDSAITLALTMTRANKKPFTVRPLAQPKAPAGDPPTSLVTPVSGDAPAVGPTKASSGQVTGSASPNIDAPEPDRDAGPFVTRTAEFLNLCRRAGVKPSTVLSRAKVGIAEDLSPEDWAEAKESLRKLVPA